MVRTENYTDPVAVLNSKYPTDHSIEVDEKKIDSGFSAPNTNYKCIIRRQKVNPNGLD